MHRPTTRYPPIRLPYLQIESQAFNLQTRLIPRAIEPEVVAALRRAPVVAIPGRRQCGKSTLAHQIAGRRGDALYLDLERPSERQRFSEPEFFLAGHRNRLGCLDEIQRAPEPFPVLRSLGTWCDQAAKEA